MKPGPLIAMIGLIFLGMWLVLQPTLERSKRIDPEAHRLEVRLGARQIAVEFRLRDDGTFEYHTKGWHEVDERGWTPAVDFQSLMAAEMEAWEQRPGFERTLLGFFNISSWFNFTWVGLGLLGQGCFLGRMFVQWIKSEREGSSVVPPVFWWLSFFGGVLLFSYFVWRVDMVGVLGQSSGVVIYARNLRLIHKQKRRLADLEARGDEQPPAGDNPPGPPASST
jgi:lipid-A-disaccharide synthase-like uncharacterized protein